MDSNKECPCEAVKELQTIVKQHDVRLAEGNTNFALIQQDLGYIKAQLDRKTKFNGTVSASIIQSIATLILGAMAVKLGLQ